MTSQYYKRSSRHSINREMRAKDARAMRDPMANAMELVEARVSNTREYHQAKNLAAWYALEAFLACTTVEDFRAAGGRTVMAKAALERALSEVHGVLADKGSPMLPTTVAGVLRLNQHQEVFQVAYMAENQVRNAQAV